MLIGKRIKELRKAKKMTLKNLAAKSGVQIATLSRIENLKMTGTLESHIRIAQALGIDITDLYQDITKKEDSADCVTDDTSTESFVYNDKASYEILTNNVLSKKMIPTVLKIEKNGKTNPEQSQVGSERFIFVLEGQIKVTINDKEYPLFSNNTLYFDAALKHQIINTGDTIAKVISVITPVSL